ncbi:transposase [Atopobium sp. oral taxon 416]|nr:transposase [Atopobium sp. oral taxon 416]
MRVGIDDTARKRNQSYISIMANLDCQRAIAVTQGRDKGALGRLCAELKEHGRGPHEGLRGHARYGRGILARRGGADAPGRTERGQLPCGAAPDEGDRPCEVPREARVGGEAQGSLPRRSTCG